MRSSVLAFVITIVMVAVGLLLWSGAAELMMVLGLSIGVLGFWLLFSLAAECFWIETPTGRGMVSMSAAVNVASIFFLPLFAALLIGGVSVLLSDLLLHRRGFLRGLFNAAQLIVTLSVCVVVMRLLGVPVESGGTKMLLRVPWATFSAPVVYFLVNTFLVSVVISLTHGSSLWRSWRENFGHGAQFSSSGVHSVIALILIPSYEALGFVAGVLYLTLFFFVRDAYQRRIDTQRLRAQLEEESRVRRAG